MNHREIEKAIKELVNFFSINDSIDEYELLELLKNGKRLECARKMAQYFKLPVKVKLLDEQEPGGPRSHNLVRTDKKGHEVQGVAAQVLDLQDVPSFLSKELEGHVVKIVVSKDYGPHPRSFLAVLAHEMAHVVLETMEYPKRESEEVVDLAAMVMGFSDILKSGYDLRHDWIEEIPGGVKTHRQKLQYGFLKDNLAYAYDRILQYRKETVRTHVSCTINCRNAISKFKQSRPIYKEAQNGLKIFVKRKKFKVDQATQKALISYFQPYFFDEIKWRIDDNLKKVEDISKKVRTKQGVVIKNLKDLSTQSQLLKTEAEMILHDASVVNKTVRHALGFWYKVGLQKI